MRAATLVTLGLLAAGDASAATRVVHLVSNEGQRVDHAADRVYLVPNDRAPAPPAGRPPSDEQGRRFSEAGFTEGPGWNEALPVWRASTWPTSTLPADDSGAVLADWIWGSQAPRELLSALFFPDHDNGTRFARRYSTAHDAAGSFAQGYIPAMLDSALFTRRELCLPLNATSADISLTIVSDGQARARVDGALILSTCTESPDACAARTSIVPMTATHAVTPGLRVLSFEAWSSQPGAPLGGLLYDARLEYVADDLNLAMIGATVDGNTVVALVRATGAIPQGVTIAARTRASSRRISLPAWTSNTVSELRVDASFAVPGALVTLEVDDADCLGRAARGDVNLVGGAPSGEGIVAAIGQVEESDELDNTASVRLPPAFDASLDESAVASASIHLRGRSEAGSRVRVWRDGTPIDEVVAIDGDTFELVAALVPGPNRFTARASGAGRESANSGAITVTYDPNAPPAPTIDRPLADERQSPGALLATGRGLTGATLLASVDGSPACELVVGADATWRCDVAALAVGPHVFVARQRSRAGLLSEPASVTFEVAVDEPDAGLPDAGADGGHVIEELPDAGQTPQVRRYAMGGGGSCSHTEPLFGALFAVGFFLVRRRRTIASLLVLALLLAPAARAQVSLDPSPFPGPTPLVSGASPRDGSPAFSLAFDDVRDPLVLFDAASGERAGSLVSRRIDARLALAFRLHEKLELGLSLPGAALQRGGTFDGIPAAQAGLSDVSAALLIGLARSESTALGLVVGASAPSATGEYLGAGRITGRVALAVNSSASHVVALGLELGARTPHASTNVLALDAREPAAMLDLRAGVALPLARFGVTPFVEFAAASPLDAGILASDATPAIAGGGVRFALPAGLELTVGAARGLTPAPGSPSARGSISLGTAPGAAGRVSRRESVAPPSLVPPPRPAIPAPPMFFAPLEGDVIPALRMPIEGEAEPLAQIAILLDGRRLATVTADAGGMFHYDLDEDLAPGLHELVASQETPRGVSDPSAPRGFLLEPLPMPGDDSARTRRIGEILRLVRETTHLAARETPEGVAVATNVLFDFDRSEIRQDQEGKLHELALVIRAFPSVQIRIDSHTDNVGSAAYNLGLSHRRAASVLTWLVDYEGIDVLHVDGNGFGDSKPVASNATNEGRAKNRRFAECVFLVP